MDYIEPDAVVNRDDPIPTLKIDGEHTNADDPKRRSPSPKKLQQALGESTSSIQDRLFSAYG